MSSEPVTSFYGVYDGHAGKDAAAFAASQLHFNLIRREEYPRDPVQAIKGAFVEADTVYLDKGQREVRDNSLPFIRGSLNEPFAP